jgi:hypothetical protein
MTYNTKDLVDFATSKNAVDFTTALNNIMTSKVSEKLTDFHEDMCKGIFKTGYEPHNSDEEKFMDKHIPAVVDYPVDNEDGLPFRDDVLQTRSMKQNNPASYDKGEDEEVYEETIQERKLTKPEMSKREEIAKALAHKFPSMNMQKKMAIATAQAKKSA